MANTTYARKKKESMPVVAICYDFDKTLSPDDMQAQGYIQSVGFNVTDFWTESNGLASDNDMDQNLAYMMKMKDEAAGKVLFTKTELEDYGSRVKLFPGVDTWFNRLRDYGLKKNVIVEHYIISSGLKEMIEGTSVAKSGAFERIYASSFYYDKNNVAVWPAQVVNYTNKTQFLFRIEKGVLDVNDSSVNDHFALADIRVPFRNIIYIGDSDTDIPCMTLVNSKGGHSIGVYNSDTGDKSKVYRMMRDGRIKYYAPADYSEGTELDELVKTIIDRTEINEKLESKYYNYKKEQEQSDRETTEQFKEKQKWINKLENSSSFAMTHEVIEHLSEFLDWDNEEKALLFDIAVNNGQVLSIISDLDLKRFYKGLLKNYSSEDSNAKEILSRLD